MKKFFVIMATVVMVLSCSLFAGCDILDTLSDKLGLTKAEGTYKFYSLTYEGETYKAGESFDGVALTADSFVVEIKEGGELTVTIIGGKNIYGTWAKNDNGKYDLKIGEEQQEATISGNTLTMEAPITSTVSMTYILKK